MSTPRSNPDIVPLRISKSINTTFLPIMAKLTEKFADTNVLPAPAFEEVNIIVFKLELSTCMKEILVLNMRKASETESRPPSRTTIAFCVLSSFEVSLRLFFFCGTSPKNGIVSFSSTSLRVRTFVSDVIFNQMIPAGIAHPKMNPAIKTIKLFGETGLSSPVAGSIIRALLSVIACVKALSSRLFKR